MPVRLNTIKVRNKPDPVFDACMLVAKAMDIQFIRPLTEMRDYHEHLNNISRASGVGLRKVMLPEQWWKGTGGPILARTVDEGRPVALIPASSGTYELQDPAKGTRRKVDTKVASTIDPLAYVFTRPFVDRALVARDLIKFGIRGCRNDFLLVISMGIAGALLGLLIPVFTGILFDSIIPDAAKSQLFQLAAVLMACAVSACLFKITNAILIVRIEGRTELSLQPAVMDRLVFLPASFFRNFTAGDLAERSMAVSSIRQVLSGVAVRSILGGIFSSFYLILLFLYDRRLALISMGLALISLAVIGVLGYLKIPHQRKIKELQGKISGVLFQMIGGVGKLRVAGAEERALAVWEKWFLKKKGFALKVGRTENLQASFQAFFPAISLIAIFAWVGIPAAGTISTGSFLAFVSAHTYLHNALLQMGTAVLAAVSIVPLYERARPILETPPETAATDPAGPIRLKGNVETRDLCFRYHSDGPVILEGVTLELKPGEFIGLVGPSGSGKSTLIRLLLGFEKPDSGAIYYDGRVLRSLHPVEFRRQLGVVLQNGKILAGDIYRNISGASSLKREEVWEAVRMAGMDADIQQMPMGLNTSLGAGGKSLSGGQRQKLLIARAIARRPRVLLLDEALSFLDVGSSADILENLRSFGSTMLVIAHRLDTVSQADRILVLEHGRIVQEGTYHHLRSQPGPFARLAEEQACSHEPDTFSPMS